MTGPLEACTEIPRAAMAVRESSARLNETMVRGCGGKGGEGDGPSRVVGEDNLHEALKQVRPGLNQLKLET